MSQTNPFTTPDSLWWRIARRLRPGLATTDPQTRLLQTSEVLPLIITGPFALVAFIWLIMATAPSQLTGHVGIFALLAVFCAVMEYNLFTLQIELASGQLIPITISLNTVLILSAGLLFGPTGLWLNVIIMLTMAGRAVRQAYQLKQPIHWLIGSISSQYGANLFGNLVGLAIFQALGGEFPLTGLAAADWLPALIGIAAGTCVMCLIMLPIFIELRHFGPAADQSRQYIVILWCALLAFTLLTSVPFALLGTLIETEAHQGLFVLYAIGLLQVNQLAHRLSHTTEHSQQRTRELARLEALGEALIQAPPDLSTLAAALHEHIEPMFPQDRVELRLYPPEQVKPPDGLHWQALRRVYPTERLTLPEHIWHELPQQAAPFQLLRNVTPVELTVPYGDALIVKIEADDPGEEGGAKEVLLGGICLLRHRSNGKPEASLAALQALASQIGAAYYRAKVHVETIVAEKMTQELAFAGRIQASFLPRHVPDVPGWDLAAGLIPARQTSGDFYDFVPLRDGRIGIVVADVADKGTGAALYMALSRTLIRTFAMQNPTAPEAALTAANARILTDAESDQFVTVFYGVLDPTAGTFCYANAGHNPGFVVHNGTVNALQKTGAPLGMFDDLQWQQQTVTLAEGQVVALYSDGISEAQNRANEEFGEERLIDAIRAHANEPAHAIYTAIIDAVQTFVGDAPQFDDMTLVIAVRRSPQSPGTG